MFLDSTMKKVSGNCDEAWGGERAYARCSSRGAGANEPRVLSRKEKFPFNNKEFCGSFLKRNLFNTIHVKKKILLLLIITH